jgi:hypothetical protein
MKKAKAPLTIRITSTHANTVTSITLTDYTFATLSKQDERGTISKSAKCPVLELVNILISSVNPAL